MILQSHLLNSFFPTFSPLSWLKTSKCFDEGSTPKVVSVIEHNLCHFCLMSFWLVRKKNLTWLKPFTRHLVGKNHHCSFAHHQDTAQFLIGGVDHLLSIVTSFSAEIKAFRATLLPTKPPQINIQEVGRRISFWPHSPIGACPLWLDTPLVLCQMDFGRWTLRLLNLKAVRIFLITPQKHHFWNFCQPFLITLNCPEKLDCYIYFMFWCFSQADSSTLSADSSSMTLQVGANFVDPGKTST